MKDNDSLGQGTPGSLAPAHVQQLGSTVEVAVGAIVSRTLMKNAGGSVTTFAFDQGQSLSEHTAPFDALVHVIDGELTVTIAGNEHPLASGDAVLMPADVPHAVRAPQATKFVLTMLKGTSSP
jgi:quercetin dioxygenase-like cupin family protein